MQAENTKNNIKTLSFGCRLNALECDKIQKMLSGVINTAIIVNTCAVTAEAERQCGQAVRRIARENPNAPIFVTGCAATRNSDLFCKIPNVVIIPNAKKMDLESYLSTPCHIVTPQIRQFPHTTPILSKKFIQVQNGCNHKCAYCVTRLLRGPATSFDYRSILSDTNMAIQEGFTELVLTGVDTASYARDGRLISDVCRDLLQDVPAIQRFRLSSLDPASPEIFKIINMIHNDTRMMPHIHLSMQSGADDILYAMHRRHNTETVRKIVNAANGITFSWDIICGFPGETDELFNKTLDLAHEIKPIRIHAFPFSPRPETEGANLPHQVNRTVSKERVRIITDMAQQNLHEFMATNIGKTVQVLVEANNHARDPHDIDVIIDGKKIPPRTVCNVKLVGIKDDSFIGITL